MTAPAYDEASALMRAGRIEELKSIKVPITLAWAEHDTLVRNRPLPAKLLPKRVEQVDAARLRACPDLGRPGPGGPCGPRRSAPKAIGRLAVLVDPEGAPALIIESHYPEWR